MEKISNAFESKSSNIKRVLIGSGISIVITIIGLLVFACLITYTKIPENTIPTVTIIIAAVSIVVGTTIEMQNLRKNGIINGSLIGLIYILTIYLISSIFEKNFSLNNYSFGMIIASICAGALGGIIGVNKK